MIFLANIKHVSSYVLKRTVSMRWFFFVPTTYFCSHQYLKCVWGARKDSLIETVLLSTNNIYFGWELNGENGFPMGTLIWKPE